MNSQKQSIIFTDLDGTLIDHYTYSFEPAKAMLATLAKNNIPVIPNTSKTFAEVKQLAARMLLDGPIIVENGSGVFIPKAFVHKHKISAEKLDELDTNDSYYVKSFSASRKKWLRLIDKLRPDFGDCFESFEDISVSRLIDVTGLGTEGAKLAKQRDYSEPLLWLADQSQKEQFIEKAKAHGARPLLGGRFLHVCGHSNKGDAMIWLADWLSDVYLSAPQKSTIQTIALGDGGNDIDMLEKADIACRIASPVHNFMSLKRKDGVFDSTQFGPLGWVEVLSKIFNLKEK